MSSRTGRSDARWAGYGPLVAVPIRITFGATGAVSAESTKYGAVTVTRAAAGRYTFTFDEPYQAFRGLAGGGHDYQGTATDGQWQVFTGYDSSAGTISLSHTVGGSETDPANGNVVDLLFFMDGGTQ